MASASHLRRDISMLSSGKVNIVSSQAEARSQIQPSQQPRAIKSLIPITSSSSPSTNINGTIETIPVDTIPVWKDESMKASSTKSSYSPTQALQENIPIPATITTTTTITPSTPAGIIQSNPPSVVCPPVHLQLLRMNGINGNVPVLWSADGTECIYAAGTYVLAFAIDTLLPASPSYFDNAIPSSATTTSSSSSSSFPLSSSSSSSSLFSSTRVFQDNDPLHDIGCFTLWSDECMHELGEGDSKQNELPDFEPSVSFPTATTTTNNTAIPPPSSLLATAEMGPEPAITLFDFHSGVVLHRWSYSSHGVGYIGNRNMQFNKDGTVLGVAGYDIQGIPIVCLLEIQSNTAKLSSSNSSSSRVDGPADSNVSSSWKPACGCECGTASRSSRGDDEEENVEEEDADENKSVDSDEGKLSAESNHHHHHHNNNKHKQHKHKKSTKHKHGDKHNVKRSNHKQSSALPPAPPLRATIEAPAPIRCFRFSPFDSYTFFTIMDTSAMNIGENDGKANDQYATYVWGMDRHRPLCCGGIVCTPVLGMKCDPSSTLTTTTTTTTRSSPLGVANIVFERSMREIFTRQIDIQAEHLSKNGIDRRFHDLETFMYNYPPLSADIEIDLAAFSEAGMAVGKGNHTKNVLQNSLRAGLPKAKLIEALLGGGISTARGSATTATTAPATTSSSSSALKSNLDMQERAFLCTNAGTVHQIVVGESRPRAETSATAGNDNDAAMCARVEGGFRLHEDSRRFPGSSSLSTAEHYDDGIVDIDLSSHCCVTIAGKEGSVRFWPSNMKKCTWSMDLEGTPTSVALRPQVMIKPNSSGRYPPPPQLHRNIAAVLCSNYKAAGGGPALLLVQEGFHSKVLLAGGHSGDITAASAHQSVLQRSQSLTPSPGNIHLYTSGNDGITFCWKAQQLLPLTEKEKEERQEGVWIPEMRPIVLHTGDKKNQQQTQVIKSPYHVTCMATRAVLETGKADERVKLESREYGLGMGKGGYGVKRSFLDAKPMVVISRETTHIACGGSDGTICIYEQPSGVLLQTLMYHVVGQNSTVASSSTSSSSSSSSSVFSEVEVTSLVFTTDGRHLISAAQDGRIFIYAAFADYRAIKVVSLPGSSVLGRGTGGGGGSSGSGSNGRLLSSSSASFFTRFPRVLLSVGPRDETVAVTYFQTHESIQGYDNDADEDDEAVLRATTHDNAGVRKGAGSSGSSPRRKLVSPRQCMCGGLCKSCRRGTTSGHKTNADNDRSSTINKGSATTHTFVTKAALLVLSLPSLTLVARAELPFEYESSKTIKYKKPVSNEDEERNNSNNTNARNRSIPTSLLFLPLPQGVPCNPSVLQYQENVSTNLNIQSSSSSSSESGGIVVGLEDGRVLLFGGSFTLPSLMSSYPSTRLLPALLPLIGAFSFASLSTASNEKKLLPIASSTNKTSVISLLPVPNRRRHLILAATEGGLFSILSTAILWTVDRIAAASSPVPILSCTPLPWPLASPLSQVVMLDSSIHWNVSNTSNNDNSSRSSSNTEIASFRVGIMQQASSTWGEVRLQIQV